jgi:hypothetical protein
MLQKFGKKANYEYFSRADEDLQRRRQHLLQQRLQNVHQSDFVFTEKKVYKGKDYRLFVCTSNPHLFFLIDEEDYEYVKQFHWVLKNDELPVTPIVNDSKVEFYELRHVLTGGKLYRKSTNLMTVYLNLQKGDNRLSNLANTDVIDTRGKLSLSQSVETEIYDYFQKEYTPGRYSMKVSSGNKHHHFSRRKCDRAETLEPMQQVDNVLTSNLFSSTITHNEKKYRVGVILKNTPLDKKRSYTYSDFAEDLSTSFLIDEEDFDNVTKLNWSGMSTKKIPYIRSQGKYPITLHDFITCRFYDKFKQGEEQFWTIDHINRIPTDNRLENLRLASRLTQTENSGKTALNEDQLLLKEEYENIMGKSKEDAVVYKFYRRQPRNNSLSLEDRAILQKEWGKEYQKFKNSTSTLTEAQKSKIEKSRQEALKRKEAFAKRNLDGVHEETVPPLPLTQAQRDMIELNRQAAIQRKEERKRSLK